MAMDSSAQPSHQEIMCSQSETLESMLVCRKPNEEKTKARPAADEQALKCPRCDSTNTKFCYYNNYSLTQPRYFCKSCRRYWTKGGTLRNVPVGGGCRKNKRSSSSSSLSSSKSRTTMYDHHQPMIMKAKNIPLTSDYARMGLDHGHDWNFNPNMPLISGDSGVIGGGAGLFDAVRGTGLFHDQTPSRGFDHNYMHDYGLMGQEMRLVNHVGIDEELMGGGGAVDFPWQMMTSYGGNGGDELELSWINGISAHGLLNTPLM